MKEQARCARCFTPLPGVCVAGRMQVAGGMRRAPGNRDEPLEVARAQRTHVDLIGNLAPFAAPVFVAHVAGQADAMTAPGSVRDCFCARAVLFVVYVAGAVGVRTVVVLVGTLGEPLILPRFLS